MDCAFRPFRVRFFGVSLGLALALNSPAASAQLEPDGEVVVSTEVVDPDPGFASLGQGRTVVAWVDRSRDGGQLVELLRGRWLDPELNTIRDAVLAVAYESELALILCPQVTAIGLDRVVFTWLESTAGVRRVVYRVVGGDGAPLTEKLFAYPPRENQDDECPQIRGRLQGFVIAWSGRSLGARTYSNDGQPTSPPITLGLPASFAHVPALAIDRNGGFAAAWVGRPTPTAPDTLLLRRFARDGKPLGRAIAITDHEVLRVALVESGLGFELVWNRRFQSGRTSIRGVRFGRDLLTRSPVRTILTSDSAVLSGAAVDLFGRTILAYHENDQVRGLVIGREHSPCGPAIRLNRDHAVGDFVVAASAVSLSKAQVAGVESSGDGKTYRLSVRRYGVPSCWPPP